MVESVHVGMGKMRVARNPARLICIGLGSCVAVALWDPSARIGGLAHVMLPAEHPALKSSDTMPAKFGDKGVRALLVEMERHGSNRYLIVAKIAGGAHMFRSASPDMEDIGRQNVEAVKRTLKELHIRVVSEDVGGSVGRTVELDTTTGKLLIKSLHGASRIL